MLPVGKERPPEQHFRETADLDARVARIGTLFSINECLHAFHVSGARGIAIDIEYVMDERTSIPALIKSLLDDARDLIREELQLFRAELRDEVSALQTVAIAFAAAAFVGLLGAMLLAVALGGAIAYVLHWPAWTGYGIVAVLCLAGGYGLCLYARARMRVIRAIPNTTDTMKENLAWMQNKSVLR